MITQRDFIFTGLQSWDMMTGSNAKDIAIEISRHNRVLYVNTPLDKKTFLSKEVSPETIRRKNVIKKQAATLRKINSNLWILDLPFTILPINFLPDGILFDTVNRLNNKKIFSFVKKIVNQLNFDNYILFIDNDIYRSFYAKNYLQPSLSIYYRRDNLIKTLYWNKHTPRLEPLLWKKCDILIANSEYLANPMKAYNKHSYNIGQGLNLNQYDISTDYPCPNDIKDIPHPIIGYAGWITSQRLDADLLHEIAKENPEYSFVMVGGEDDCFKNHLLHTLPNFHFTGVKESTEIPAYIASFDICMNPQQVNDITIGNYPRKIDEYLALGKPTIATRTSTTQEVFKDYVFLASNKDEYIVAIKKALKEINDKKKKEERIKFAHTHSWANNVNKIYSIIKQVQEKLK